MKKSIIALLAIVVLTLPLAGCISNDDSEKTITPLTTKLNTVEAAVNSHTVDIAKLKDDLNRKADSSRVDNLASSISNSNGSSKDVYTKSEINDLISQLKDDQSWIKKSASTSTGTNTNGNTNSTTVYNGISVSLDKTQLYSMSTETGNKDVSATIKNNSGSGKNVTLYLSLTPSSPIEDAKITAAQAKSTLTGFNTLVDGTKQHTLDVSTITTKVVWVIPSFYLEDGAEKPIWFNFNVKTNETATWTIGLKAVDL